MSGRFSRWTRPLTRLARSIRAANQATVPACDADLFVYRLTRWPHLPSSTMSTDIYRTLSVMSMRPVNRRWILDNSKLRVHEVDRLLRRLVEQDAVAVTDTSNYPPHANPA